MQIEVGMAAGVKGKREGRRANERRRGGGKKKRQAKDDV